MIVEAKDHRGLPLLTEEFLFVPKKVEVLLEDKDGYVEMLIEGEFGVVDKKNANGRIYPRWIMEREVKAFNEKGGALGTLDHPADGKTRLTETSHKVEKLWIDEDGIIHGVARVIRTNRGKDLRALYEAKAPVGVSSRGFGSTIKDRDGVKVVQADFRLKTFDFVEDPSAGVYPSVKKENKLKTEDVENTEESVNEAVIDVDGKTISTEKDDNGDKKASGMPTDDQEKREAERTAKAQSDTAGEIAKGSEDMKKEDEKSKEEVKCEACGDVLGEGEHKCSESKDDKTKNEESEKDVADASDNVEEESGDLKEEKLALEKEKELLEEQKRKVEEAKEYVKESLDSVKNTKKEIKAMITENSDSVTFAKIKSILTPLLVEGDLSEAFVSLNEKIEDLEENNRNLIEEVEKVRRSNSRLSESLDRTIRRLIMEEAYVEVGHHNIEVFDKAVGTDRESMSLKEFRSSVEDAKKKLMESKDYLSPNALIETLNVMNEKGADLQEENQRLIEERGELFESVNLYKAKDAVKDILEKNCLLEGYNNQDEIIESCARRYITKTQPKNLLTESVKIEESLEISDLKQIVEDKGIASSPKEYYNDRKDFVSRVRSMVNDSNIREQLTEGIEAKNAKGLIVGTDLSVGDFKKLSGI